MAAALMMLVAAAACSGGVAETAEDLAPVSPSVMPETSVPEPSPTVEPTPASQETPTPDPVEEQLAELRATNRFLELAEHERAQHATWARFGWEAFAPFRDGEKLFDWSNKAELWDEIAPPFRDECLLAGPEATRPMWDAQVVVPAGIEPRWSDVSTGGRGQFVEFVCLYHDEVENEPVELWWAVLINTDDALVGEVVARMEAFDVREAEYEDFADAGEGVTGQLWRWVSEQGVTAGGSGG